MSNTNFKLSTSLSDNLKTFKEVFKNDNAIIFRELENKYINNMKCCIVFADGMTNKEIINKHIIEPLMNINLKNLSLKDDISTNNILDVISKKVITSTDVNKKSNTDEIIKNILYGDTLILVDGVEEALMVDTKGWPIRAIEEPKSEKRVKGPREGFTESIMTNTTLIRRKIKTPDLKFIFSELGTRTKTNICICYIDGIARDEIVTELKTRLQKIIVDGILDSNYIEEFIKDSPLSLFKTIGNTESPDVAAGKLLEGRIILMCDGTPFVLTLPYIFLEYFQSYEDYYNNYLYASSNRLLRILAFFLGISVPALYLSVATFHQELLPTSLILSISAARYGIPFPTVVEAILMIIVFALQTEAAMRLPTPIGQSLNIVGALILGDAAVNARIISAPMVIIVAITGIASFLIPKMLGAFAILRIVFLLLASFLGLYGYTFGIMGLFIYLVSLRSFGVPYMLDTCSINLEDLKDTAIRAPLWLMNLRPKLIAKDRTRRSK
jgi:spore germination protein KA